MTPTPAAEVAPAPKRRRPWWVLVAIFVGGLVIGVLLWGVTVLVNRAAERGRVSPSAAE